jgi:hypothetical protein
MLRRTPVANVPVFVGAGVLALAALAAAAPAPVDESRIWVYHDKAGKLIAYDLKGRPQRQLDLKGNSVLALSPALNKLWFAGRNGHAAALLPPGGGAGEKPLTLHVREINDKTEGTNLGIEFTREDYLFPGGKTLARSRRKVVEGKPLAFDDTLVDVATGQETVLNLPDNHQPYGMAPDGKWVLTFEYNFQPEIRATSYRLYQFPLQGGKPRLLSGALSTIYGGRISPDGKRVLAFARDKTRKDQLALTVSAYVIDVATAKPVRIAGDDRQLWSCGVWSPDGRRIAYAWRAIADKEPIYSEGVPPTRLVTCDADGRNAETILTSDGFFWPLAWW